MGTKYEKAPVFYTVGQVRHNPLLSLGAFIPEIQEQMRKAGYPDFMSTPQVQFTFHNSTGGAEDGHFQPTLQKTERYLFSNIKGTQGFVMDGSSISFQSTDYETFDVFFAQIEKGLKILSEAVQGLSYFERLGLRYLDAVAPRDGESFEDYLAREVLGLPACSGLAELNEFNGRPLSFHHSFSESKLAVPGIGEAISRVVIQSGTLRFPPDISPEPLKVKQRFQDLSGEHALLDIDASFAERKEYNASEVSERFHQLHDLLGLCFGATVTDFARNVWNEKDDS
jgi:uncharacterized protein (TIGR04255 family)